MKIDGNKRYIVYEMSRKEAEASGYDMVNQFGRIKIGGRVTNGIAIEVDEDLYRAYYRDEAREEQRAYRARRCIVTSDKTGKAISCKGKCSECTHKQTGAVLSLDKFREDNDLEFSGGVKDDTASVLTNLLKETVVTTLKKTDPLLAEVFQRVYDCESQQAIADELGLKKRAVQSLVKAYRKIAQGIVSREDILS